MAMTKSSRTERGLFRLTRSHLLWICPIIGLMAGVTILWLFGIGLWTVVAFLFLIVCPFVVAWVLLIERQETKASRNQP
jgi:membrane protein implicated in regulation of membrane protease activity